MTYCKYCKYSTENSKDYKKHLERKTHMMLENKSNQRKLRRNEREIEKEKKIIVEVVEQVDAKLIDIKKQQLITDEKVDKMSKNVKKITDYIEFLNTYCLDAEPITMLTDDDIDEILELDKYKKYKFEEMIIGYMKYNKLSANLGELIVKKFLNNEELKKQQIWTSDISRLIYLILQMIGTKKNWVRDKKGEIFTKLITEPIINRIKTMMKKYAVHMMSLYDNDDEYNPENQIILEKVQYSRDFISESHSDELKLGLLKYSASKFSIAAKKENLEITI